MIRFGSIEGGGTKFNYAVFDEQGVCISQLKVMTKTPEATLQQGVAFFREHDIDALGIGMFGPLNLQLDSAEYGSVCTTPKPYWSYFNVYRYFLENLQVPIGFNTDVNAAALGEAAFGVGKGLKNLLYITVGTGIGAGSIVDGKLLHGASHPEMGHIIVPRHEQDTFQGICKFHQNCLEGMASGPALEARWKVKGDQLEESHPAWELEAHYMAQALINYMLTLAPDIIVLGGGVMQQPHLLAAIKKKVQAGINGYHPFEQLLQREGYIVNPGLGGNSGIAGGLCLAIQAYEHANGEQLVPISQIHI